MNSSTQVISFKVLMLQLYPMAFVVAVACVGAAFAVGRHFYLDGVSLTFLPYAIAYLHPVWTCLAERSEVLLGRADRGSSEPDLPVRPPLLNNHVDTPSVRQIK